MYAYDQMHISVAYRAGHRGTIAMTILRHSIGLSYDLQRTDLRHTQEAKLTTLTDAWAEGPADAEGLFLPLL